MLSITDLYEVGVLITQMALYFLQQVERASLSRDRGSRRAIRAMNRRHRRLTLQRDYLESHAGFPEVGELFTAMELNALREVFPNEPDIGVSYFDIVRTGLEIPYGDDVRVTVEEIDALRREPLINDGDDDSVSDMPVLITPDEIRALMNEPAVTTRTRVDDTRVEHLRQALENLRDLHRIEHENLVEERRAVMADVLWDDDTYAETEDAYDQQFLEMTRRQRQEIEDLTSRMERTTVQQHLPLDLQEAHRRYCHRCGGDVYIYHDGHYWCQPCIDGADTDDTPTTQHTSMDNSTLERLCYMYNVQPTTMEELINRINYVAGIRHLRFSRMENEVNSAGNVTWNNPFTDDIPVFVESLDVISRSFTGLVPHGEATRAWERLEEEFRRSGSSMDTDFCTCNEIDRLLLNWCHVCYARLFAYLGGRPIEPLYWDARTNYMDMMLAHQRAHEYTLPDSSYDNHNMAEGQDDHGHSTLGEVEGKWSVAGVQTCVVCYENLECVGCVNGHYICNDCLDAWLSTSAGLCPICRARMER
jgi:hypothetical protein